jgi:hypothetical protein
MSEMETLFPPKQSEESTENAEAPDE